MNLPGILKDNIITLKKPETVTDLLTDVPRNEYFSEREIQTGIDPVAVQVPRVRDKKISQDEIHPV